MRRKFTAVIVDADESGISKIKQSLTVFPDILVIGSFTTVTEAKEQIISRRPDILFFDLEMSETDGLGMLRQVYYQKDWDMQVIFHTKYRNNLLDVLDKYAFDYLLKPYSEIDFNVVMKRFSLFQAEKQMLYSFRSPHNSNAYDTKAFMVATVTGFQILQSEKIVYCDYEKSKKLWIIVLNDYTYLKLKRNTKAKDILQYSYSFIQINQHQIVNLNYIDMIKGNECILVPTFENKNRLVISRNCLRTFQEKFCII